MVHETSKQGYKAKKHFTSKKQDTQNTNEDWEQEHNAPRYSQYTYRGEHHEANIMQPYKPFANPRTTK